ncbi:hypothetical protein FHR47_001317 [Xanthomonas arboricola]|nr:hypothetical protein [Xanthomonas cannabis]
MRVSILKCGLRHTFTRRVTSLALQPILSRPPTSFCSWFPRPCPTLSIATTSS